MQFKENVAERAGMSESFEKTLNATKRSALKVLPDGERSSPNCAVDPHSGLKFRSPLIRPCLSQTAGFPVMACTPKTLPRQF
ncbi:MAG: hypothetical protein FD139_1132 [Methylocystaceae bacterium]|nr:MAG: hypothetical protein FD139_1132 [Methylocystaceae bacterium]